MREIIGFASSPHTGHGYHHDRVNAGRDSSCTSGRGPYGPPSRIMISEPRPAPQPATAVSNKSIIADDHGIPVTLMAGGSVRSDTSGRKAWSGQRSESVKNNHNGEFDTVNRAAT